MEDDATAEISRSKIWQWVVSPKGKLDDGRKVVEISRSQIWQWVVSPKGKLDDGRKVDAAMVRALIPEELAKIKAFVAAAGEDTATYDQAAKIFEEMRSEEHTSELKSLMRSS